MLPRFLMVAAFILASLPVFGRNSPENIAPFKPHWSFLSVLTHMEQDSGQVSTDIAFTATRNLTETGHYLSCGLMGGRKRLEGEPIPFGGLVASGGLGAGDFTPSLTLNLGGGTDSYRSFDITLGLDYQMADPLSMNLALFREYEQHQTDSTQVLGSLGLATDRGIQVASTSWGGIAGVAFRPFAWMSVPISAGYWKNLTGNVQGTANGHGEGNDDDNESEGTTASGTVGLVFRFLKHWSTGANYQRGHDTLPNEPYYLPRAGSTVASTDGSLDWNGWSFWAGYSF